MEEITKNIKFFIHNPLGIMALFVTVCYGIAGMVFGDSFACLEGVWERQPVIWYIVLFPIIIFSVFVWLVVKHNSLLYGPGDFKDEKMFLYINGMTFEPGKEPKKIKKEEKIEISNKSCPTANRKNETEKILYKIEELVLRKLSEDEGMTIKSDIRVAGSNLSCVFDGYGEKDGKSHLVEVKFLSGGNDIERVIGILNRQANVVFEVHSRNAVFDIVFVVKEIINEVQKQSIMAKLDEQIQCEHKYHFYTLKEIEPKNS